jgi:hypothetical protein
VAVCAGEALSVTCTGTVYVPAEGGVPERTPVAATSVSQLGRELPEAANHVQVPEPPEAVRVVLYGCPVVADGSDVVVIVSVPPLPQLPPPLVDDTVNEKLCCWVAPLKSVTWIGNTNWPTWMGVPERTPPGLRVKPWGVAEVDHVYGVAPPDAWKATM